LNCLKFFPFFLDISDWIHLLVVICVQYCANIFKYRFWWNQTGCLARGYRVCPRNNTRAHAFLKRALNRWGYGALWTWSCSVKGEGEGCLKTLYIHFFLNSLILFHILLDAHYEHMLKFSRYYWFLLFPRIKCFWEQSSTYQSRFLDRCHFQKTLSKDFKRFWRNSTWRDCFHLQLMERYGNGKFLFFLCWPKGRKCIKHLLLFFLVWRSYIAREGSHFKFAHVI